MKSQWFSNRARYEFGKLLEASGRGRQCWDTFGAFLGLATLTLRQANCRMITGLLDDKIEAEYMKLVAKVDKPSHLAEAMGVLVDSLEKEPEDFLGKFMSEMSMNDKHYRGQCFTPKEVCTMMAKMVAHDLADNPAKRLLISEPASGCGAMVIATAKEFRETGRDFYFVTTDVDLRCAQACFIQLTLCDIPASVIHGNTLTLEQWSCWDTLRAILRPWREKTSVEPCKPETARLRNPVQLELF